MLHHTNSTALMVIFQNPDKPGLTRCPLIVDLHSSLSITHRTG